MAKQPDESKRTQETFLEQARELWDKYARKFFNSLEENPKKRLNVQFTACLDLGGQAPVVDTQICWKDKDTADGLQETISYRASLTTKLEVKEQQQLPGTEKAKGRKPPEPNE